MRLAYLVAPLVLAACQPAAKPVAAVIPTIDPAHAIPAAPEGLTPSIPETLAASKPEEWRTLDPENTLYMEFPPVDGKGGGRVIIALAPDFAPNHVANVKALSREGYFASGAAATVMDTIPRVLGRPAISFEQFASDPRATFLA